MLFSRQLVFRQEMEEAADGRGAVLSSRERVKREVEYQGAHGKTMDGYQEFLLGGSADSYNRLAARQEVQRIQCRRHRFGGTGIFSLWLLGGTQDGGLLGGHWQRCATRIGSRLLQAANGRLPVDSRVDVSRVTVYNGQRDTILGGVWLLLPLLSHLLRTL